MDLVTFLRGQLDEDERWARSPECDQDPDRLLREVEAKRRILDRWQETSRPFSDSRQQEIHETIDEEVLPLLALPYSDHPEYRQEWKP